MDFAAKHCCILLFLNILYIHINFRSEMTYFPVLVLNNSGQTLFPPVFMQQQNALRLGKRTSLLLLGDTSSFKTLNQVR